MEALHQLFVESHLLSKKLKRGIHPSLRRGQGLEFFDIRPYQIGDTEKSIDPYASARLGKWFVRTFVEEKHHDVVFIMDVSGSLDIQNKKYYSSLIAASLMQAWPVQDHIGLILFSNHIEIFIPPGREDKKFLIKKMFSIKPKEKKTDFSKLFSFINRSFKKKTLFFILSDFFGSLKGNIVPQHTIFPIAIHAPMEKKFFKKGLFLLKDPETEEELWVDSSKKTEEILLNSLENKKKLIRRFFSHPAPLFLETGTSFIKPILFWFREMCYTLG